MDTGPALMTLCAITFDCADPMALAAFYEKVTGLSEVDGSDDEFAGLRGSDGLFVGFQRVDDYHAPQWPGQQEPQQVHLDFEVDDLDLAEAALLRLGARKPAPGHVPRRCTANPVGFDERPAEPVPLRSCVCRGGAIDLILDLGREKLFPAGVHHRPGCDAVIWQSPRHRKHARYNVRRPSARAANGLWRAPCKGPSARRIRFIGTSERSSP